MSRLREFWQRLGWTVGIVVCLLVIGFSIYAIIAGRAAGRLQAAVERRRAAGLPVDPVDIIPPTPLPDENAAIAYLPVLEHFVGGPFDWAHGCGCPEEGVLADVLELHDPDKHPQSYALTEAGRQTMRAALAPPEVDELLARYLSVREYPHCIFPVVYTPEMRMRRYHLDGLSCVAWIAREAAVLAAADGDAERATRLLAANLILARHLRDMPDLDHHRFAWRLNCRTLRDLVGATGFTDFTPAQLADLQDQFARQDPRGRLGPAIDARGVTYPLKIEHWQAHATASAAQQGKGMQTMVAVEQVVTEPTVEADIAAFLDGLPIARRQFDQPWHAADQQALDRYLAPLPKRYWRARRLKVFFPPQEVATVEAALATAVVGCALLRYRCDHDDFPATLAELVPDYLDAVPLNPFTGKDLPYTRTAAGWAIPNLSTSKYYDTAWTYPPLPTETE